MGEDTRHRGVEGGDEVFTAVDPDLNIFALANGMDLYRDHVDPPDRVLEWFRDGLERRIHLLAAAKNAFDVEVAARGKIDGAHREARVGFREGIAPGQLKGLLAEAIDAANTIEREELRES